MTKTRNTAINATKWSAIERFAVQFIQFIISIIIARLLHPSDYGIIGMITILLGVSQTFMDSGFSQALIYKTDRSMKDLCTVFYFNIVVGLFLYVILYLIAPFVARFYQMPILTDVTRTVSLSIPITSFAIVQRALLTARSDFKSQTYATIPAALISGILGILLAYKGYGVWSLVWQQISYLIIDVVILWMVSQWRPIRSFSLKSLRSFFSYGSKLLASGLIDTLFNNSYLLVIGKCFKATELGLYSRAKTFPYFASVNLASIFQRALFPILCEVKHDQDRLVHIYREYLKLSIAIISPLVLGICALSKPLILSLLSDKWIDAVPVLHILCFSYLFSPIVMLNNNVYQVTGNTALFLKLEFIKKIIGVSFLVVSLPFGLYGVLIGSVLSALISLIYNMHFTSTMIPLTIRMQVYDILPIFILSAIMAVIVYVSILFIPIYWVQIIGGILVGGFSYSILLKLVIPCTFMNIKEIILKTIRK